MNTRTALLRRAADNFRLAGDLLAAAGCRSDAGDHEAAADLLREAGDLAGAAVQFRLAGNFQAAAACFAECGRAGDAADAWAAIGNRLFAGWALLRGTGSARHLRQVGPRVRAHLAAAADRRPAHRLLRSVGLALCAPDPARASALLSNLVAGAAADLANWPAVDRRLAEEWLVHATALLGRHDLGAMVFAASYRAGTAGALDRWRRWADRYLGDRTGLPSGPPAGVPSLAAAPIRTDAPARRPAARPAQVEPAAVSCLGGRRVIAR